jgi:hypothetical protein
MSKTIRCAVKTNDFQLLIYTIGCFYTIDNHEITSFRKEEEFVPDKRILILNNEVNKEWIQIEFEVLHPHELDELIRRITFESNNVAFFMFRQTVDETLRFVFFSQGVTVRSYYQEYLRHHQQLRVMENFGAFLSFENELEEKLFFQIVTEEKDSKYDNLKVFFNQVGFLWDGLEEADFHYLSLSGYK